MSNSIIVMAPLANPAGSDTQIQFNNSGVFGADSNLSWNNSGNGVFVVKDFELSFVDGSGHDITIENTYSGGNFTILSSAGVGIGACGTLTIKGGTNSSSNPSATGGGVIVQGGNSSSTLGSNVSIKGGTATGGNTGDVLIQDITMPKPIEGDDGKALTYDHATTSYVLSTISIGSQTPWTSDIDPAGYALKTAAKTGGNSSDVVTISSGSITSGTTGGSGNVEISTGQIDSGTGDCGNIIIGPGTTGGSGLNGKLQLECGSNTFEVNATVTTVTIYDTWGFIAGTTALVITNNSGTPKLGFFGATEITQPSVISDPSGGVIQDSEARTAINSIIDLLQSLGLMGT